MTKIELASIFWCLLVGGVGLLIATKPRIIPQMTNAYYAWLGFKTRIAMEDYDRVSVNLGVRIVGLGMFVIACYVFFVRVVRF